MLKKLRGSHTGKADYVPLNKDRPAKEIPCVEQGKPFATTLYVMARSWQEAIKKARKGDGRTATKEEIKSWETEQWKP